MVGDTLTLALEGDVSLRDFAAVVLRFRELIDVLSAEIGGDAAIDWVVENLETGSALMTVRGESEETEAVERVVRAYQVVGTAVERSEPIPYSRRVRDAVHGITKVLNGRITALRFETAGYEATVTGPTPIAAGAVERYAYGAVEGRVETLTERNTLRFTLHDSIHDRAVACYLSEERRETMRDAWGKRAIVEGWVTRDASTGRPISVREVRSVTILPEVPAGTYRNARGASPRKPEDPMPEERIGLARDA